MWQFVVWKSTTSGSEAKVVGRGSRLGALVAICLVGVGVQLLYDKLFVLKAACCLRAILLYWIHYIA